MAAAVVAPIKAAADTWLLPPLASACERSSAKARTAHPTSRVASSVAATSSISAASSMQKPNPKRARTRAMKHAMQEKRRQTLA
ncbi:Uncharacterised protein [Bordetella pertussis]|nr:Uncharacterised protein [Bordetella pertussis]CFW15959.1 Uncharacterised protein [Bordetella pertussis]CFW36370.1 Uncharacterised protein [Bordetella pertussis]